MVVQSNCPLGLFNDRPIVFRTVLPKECPIDCPLTCPMIAQSDCAIALPNPTFWLPNRFPKGLPTRQISLCKGYLPFVSDDWATGSLDCPIDYPNDCPIKALDCPIPRENWCRLNRLRPFPQLGRNGIGALRRGKQTSPRRKCLAKMRTSMRGTGMIRIR